MSHKLQAKLAKLPSAPTAQELNCCEQRIDQQERLEHQSRCVGDDVFGVSWDVLRLFTDADILSETFSDG